MPDLTPERCRDAAEVVQQLNASGKYGRFDSPMHSAWAPVSLLDVADELEREQAAEAKREKRIEELACELRVKFREPASTWEDMAVYLIDRYPALAEVTDE